MKERAQSNLLKDESLEYTHSWQVRGKVGIAASCIGRFSNAPCAAHTVIVGRRGVGIYHPLYGSFDKEECNKLLREIPAQVRDERSSIYVENPKYREWLNQQYNRTAQQGMVKQ